MFTPTSFFGRLSKPVAGPHSVAKRSVHRLPYLHYKIEEGIRPVFSKKAATYHYKHIHGGHLKRLNLLIEATPSEMKALEEIILVNRVNSDDAAVFNQAASCYNHTFMWLSMIPDGRPPSEWMMAQLQTNFGGFDNFKDQWKNHCRAIFGQGWVWLIDNDGHLEIATAFNAGNPLGRRGINPLLLTDMWEHAYLMDYGNDVEQYVENWFHAVNWEFVETMLRKVETGTHVSISPEEVIQTGPTEQ
eukprot:TRINITY_DN205_c1_g1_i1.p1 TRINITY_DN205_c1_g1~~TRINITY_DN205_c1_g1_i1.p1  ORF type:complete len:245 (+),score=64.80 TRINITY_DN205_c1_g1_i1:121-855(+)